MRPSDTAVIASCARPTPKSFPLRPRKSPDRLIRFLRLSYSGGRTHRDLMRVPRPLREFLRIVVEPLGHPPIGRQLAFAIFGRVAESAEAFRFEVGNRFGVGLEVDHVARDQRDHPSIDKDALAAEHAAHGYRPEFTEE